MRHEFGPFFNLFNDTFNELQRISDTTSKPYLPKFDLKEEKDSYKLEGEIPGIDQKNVVIEFSDEQTLTIKGHTEHSREEGQPPTEATEVKESEAQPTSESKDLTAARPTDVAKDQPRNMYWVSERSVGKFARSFNFPTRVDQDNVKASMKNGVLSVVVPKLAKQETKKRINIE